MQNVHRLPCLSQDWQVPTFVPKPANISFVYLVTPLLLHTLAITKAQRILVILS